MGSNNPMSSLGIPFNGAPSSNPQSVTFGRAPRIAPPSCFPFSVWEHKSSLPNTYLCLIYPQSMPYVIKFSYWGCFHYGSSFQESTVTLVCVASSPHSSVQFSRSICQYPLYFSSLIFYSLLKGNIWPQIESLGLSP